MEEKLRQQAVALIAEGHTVTEVARALGKSRQWVYKWIGRSSENTPDWSKSLSKSPHNLVKKISGDIEEEVVRVRKELERDPHKESGAYPIMHELIKRGITPPSIATINRIIKRHGLVRGKIRYSKSGIDYPENPINMQVMDLIGPRYLRGGHRFYLLNIISNDTRHAGVYPILSKGAEEITKGVVSFWKSYSVPDVLQMDNELSFKGSNRHPRGLGQLLRTALSLDVTPRFIPVGEPWRNGVVERFNQKVEKTLLVQEHRDFDDLLQHAAEFTQTHNTEHHYSTLDHKTPVEMDEEFALTLRPLNQEYTVEKRPVIDPLNINEIKFIRLVRSDCLINILNTDIEVNPSLMHTYVEATICLNDHCLRIFQDGDLKEAKEFIMPVI